MQAQIGKAQIPGLQASPERSAQHKSLYALRKRSCSSRRPQSIRSAASVSTKQVQDDQVELGKTGTQAVCITSFRSCVSSKQ